MPISVTCHQCAKILKVKNEWAGRLAKCPGCGATFTVPGAAAATRFDPASAAAARAQREQQSASRVAVPWGLVLAGTAVLLFIVGIAMFLMGPKKVWNEWERIGGAAQDDVIDVVSRGLERHMAEIGAYDPSKPHAQPHATEVLFYRPTLVMSMPDTVDFQGGSTEGEFVGKYHPKNGEVEATVQIRSASSGRGPNKVVPQVKITGRVKGGNVTTEIDGKKMD